MEQDAKTLAEAPLANPMEHDVLPTSTEETAAQATLFDLHDWWEPYWQGMPEFDQHDLSAFCSLTVNFACEADLQDFAALIEQKLTNKTRSVWHPTAEIGRYANKRYISHADA